MKIFTSYFAKLKTAKNPVSICGKAPDFYKGPQYKKLAPKYGFFMDWKNGKIDDAGYVKCFNEQVLSNLDPVDVVSELQALYPDEECVTLICYEKSSDFCHRHLVAAWLEKHGYDVEKEM